MKTQSPDTSPAVEAVLVRLARELPPRRKLELAFSMTDAVRHAARAGLRSRYPQAPPEEPAESRGEPSMIREYMRQLGVLEVKSR